MVIIYRMQIWATTDKTVAFPSQGICFSDPVTGEARHTHVFIEGIHLPDVFFLKGPMKKHLD